MSSFLATETMTSVPQTQKISQKKRAHSSKSPTLKLPKLTIFKAIMLKSIPKTLFNAQCLVMKQQQTGIAARTKARIEATDSSISLIYRCFLSKAGTLIVEKLTLYLGGRGNRGTSSSAVENTVVRQKYEVISNVTTSALKYLQIMQMPNKKQEATIGNLMASFMPMVQLSPDQISLNVNLPLFRRT